MKTSPSRLLSSLFTAGALACLAAAGCTGTSPYMTPASHGPVEAAADSATVVFVRPSEFGGADRVKIIDGKGRFLGESMPETYFATKVPPGEHLFIAWGELTSVVKANVAAGRVYYVELSGPSGPFVYMKGVGMQSADYGKLDGWLAKAKPLATDEAKGQAEITADPRCVEKVLARANTVFAEYEPSELPAQTLGVEDGKPTAGVQPASPAPGPNDAPKPGDAPKADAPKPGDEPKPAPAAPAPAAPDAK